MSDPQDAVVRRILDKPKAMEASGTVPSLSVAVLGPGLRNDEDPGTRKRYQIYNALRGDGHSPFFLEDRVGSGPTSLPVLVLESQILRNPAVALVIILYTSASPGAAAELGYLMSFPEIKAKTAVLIPVGYYQPDDNIVANTVREYAIRMPYSDKHFEECQLVSECRKWAYDRATGERIVVNPRSF